MMCGKLFWTKPCYIRYGWSKYCSIECRNRSQLKGHMFKCYTCGADVYKSPAKELHSQSHNFFCSKFCQTQWRNKYFSREKHSNWKGGTATYRDILKTSKREEKCMICKISNKAVLVAHHIDHNRKNNDISNLTWLCMNCHFLVHHNQNLDNKIKKHQSISQKFTSNV